jgi:hypothetical protein
MTPDQLQTLSSEVTADPLTLGYQSHLPSSPGLVVQLLNTPMHMKIKSVTTSAAKTWAASGPYAAIVDAANMAGHPARASALVVRDAFASGDPIHMEDPNIQALFANWITANVITQEQHDALIAMAMQPASRAEVLGLPFVTEQDLIAAGVQS